MKHRAFAAFAASLVLTLSAVAQDLSAAAAGSQVLVRLDTGETLLGTVVAQTNDTLIITHAFAGDIPIPIANIQELSVTAAPPTAKETSAPSSEPAESAEPDTDETDIAPSTSFFTGWSGSAELGLAGSSGVTETTNFRTGATTKRTTDLTTSSLRFTYTYASEDSNTNANKSKLIFQHDWRTDKEDRYSYFVRAIGEYDQFQSWRWRTSGYAGLGYRFIDNDTTTLTGRIGAGVTREFGSPRNDLMPEALLGVLDLTHQITPDQRFTATLDIYPSLERFGPYRADATAAYEILLNKDNGLTLKLGIEDAYDSTPGDGINRNDFNYFAVLLWNF